MMNKITPSPQTSTLLVYGTPVYVLASSSGAQYGSVPHIVVMLFPFFSRLASPKSANCHTSKRHISTQR
jgi:hypothetical protein